MTTTKWEYLVVYIQDSRVAQGVPEMDIYMDADTFTDRLNKYGEAGWELVSFQWTDGGGAKVALKRPAPVKPQYSYHNTPADLVPKDESTDEVYAD